jgi:hypothetical protein
MNLQWNKCDGNQWCNFLILNLDHPHFDNFEGVYIIWHGAPDPAVVYVGQGFIKDRLKSHREEPWVQKYKTQGLLVTWAKVDRQSRDGVERFLANKWQPKEGEKHPDVPPIEVNSPW